MLGLFLFTENDILEISLTLNKYIMAYSVTIDVNVRQVSINGINYTFAGLKAKANKSQIENEISRTCQNIQKTTPLLFTEEELDELYSGNDNAEMYRKYDV